jgi:hypothetical protein
MNESVEYAVRVLAVLVVVGLVLSLGMTRLFSLFSWVCVFALLIVGPFRRNGRRPLDGGTNGRRTARAVPRAGAGGARITSRRCAMREKEVLGFRRRRGLTASPTRSSTVRNGNTVRKPLSSRWPSR